ncbi:MAG: alpha/beta hydrolase [Burkholderiaceae bacterium]|nr:alpha/beta fold hydrolase [Burkholderiaceae bacterium]MCO5104667.1 alpha/beta hydrolase [Burkholderiaceae bacterium]
MIEPRLNYVSCAGAAAGSDQDSHRMAYWEWNATGRPEHPHVVVCVHGLSRQGRDFDTLARALAPHARVICPDVVGRGESDWLADPMHYEMQHYAGDMLSMLGQLQQQAPIGCLDWVGTSMGGLIGMAVASLPAGMLPVPVRRLILNDVGPAIEWSALERIGQYLGAPLRFETPEQAAAQLWALSTSFGPHTPEQWMALTRPMLRKTPEGLYRLHYDPAIAQPFRALTREAAEQGEALLWQLYDAIGAETLLLRGAQSDLLTAATAQVMAKRGPRARCVEFAGVGHAPTLVAADQVDAVCQFLLAPPRPISP